MENQWSICLWLAEKYQSHTQTPQRNSDHPHVTLNTISSDSSYIPVLSYQIFPMGLTLSEPHHKRALQHYQRHRRSKYCMMDSVMSHEDTDVAYFEPYM